MLGRRVSAGGRTSAFVAGRAATAADLQALGGRLIAFFGQHEHRKLTIASTQLDVLDGFVGAEQLELRERYGEAHRECLRLAAELAELREREGSRERDLDLYRYELSEIEEVAPDAEEREAIAAERERLRHAEGLREAAAGAHAALAGAEEDGGGAAAALAAGGGAAGRAAGVDPRLDALAERVAALAVELADVGSELRDYGEGVEADPAALQAIEERLEAIDRLERKHGGSVESVLAHAERCREEIARLRGRRGARGRGRGGAGRGGARAGELAAKLSEARAKPARPLEERVAAELESLAMAGATLRGHARAAPRRLRAERPRDGRAAAGAEPGDRAGADPRRGLRRRALAGDAGAERPRPRRRGRRPWSSTRSTPASAATPPASSASGCGPSAPSRQVLCITHLPQVASLADVHFRLEKDVAGDAGRWPGSSVSTAREWWRRSAACSAVPARTRRRPGTPASCSPRPDPTTTAQVARWPRIPRGGATVRDQASLLIAAGSNGLDFISFTPSPPLSVEQLIDRYDQFF